MAQSIIVCDGSGARYNIPFELDEEGNCTVTLETIKHHFPNAEGLEYHVDGVVFGLKYRKGVIYLNQDIREYQVRYPKSIPATGSKLRMQQRIMATINGEDDSSSENSSNEVIDADHPKRARIRMKHGTRTMKIGWKHRRSTDEKYKQVLAPLGGVVSVKLSLNQKYFYQDILDLCISKMANPENKVCLSSTSKTLGTFADEVIQSFTNKTGEECHFWEYVKANVKPGSRLSIYILSTDESGSKDGNDGTKMDVPTASQNHQVPVHGSFENVGEIEKRSANSASKSSPTSPSKKQVLKKIHDGPHLVSSNSRLIPDAQIQGLLNKKPQSTAGSEGADDTVVSTFSASHSPVNSQRKIENRSANSGSKSSRTSSQKVSLKKNHDEPLSVSYKSRLNAGAQLQKILKKHQNTVGCEGVDNTVGSRYSSPHSVKNRFVNEFPAEPLPWKKSENQNNLNTGLGITNKVRYVSGSDGNSGIGHTRCALFDKAGNSNNFTHFSMNDSAKSTLSKPFASAGTVKLGQMKDGIETIKDPQEIFRKNPETQKLLGKRNSNEEFCKSNISISSSMNNSSEEMSSQYSYQQKRDEPNSSRIGKKSLDASMNVNASKNETPSQVNKSRAASQTKKSDDQNRSQSLRSWFFGKDEGEPSLQFNSIMLKPSNKNVRVMSISRNAYKESHAEVTGSTQELPLSIPEISRNSIDIPPQSDAEKLLGCGSYGYVVKARYHGDVVAVKCIKQSLSTNNRNVVREISIMDKLRQRNIVQIHAYIIETFWVHIIMEYVPGANLRKVLTSQEYVEKLTVSIRISYGIQLCRGTNYMHSLSPYVLHRDIKPENIMIDKNHNLKICDFGLGRLSELPEQLESSVDGNNVKGTPLYIAPEILMKNVKASPKSDTYATALVVGEALTGRKPYKIESPPVTYAKMEDIFKNNELPDLEGIPEPLKMALKPCLHKDPQKRADVAYLLQSLEAVARSEGLLEQREIDMLF